MSGLFSAFSTDRSFVSGRSRRLTTAVAYCCGVSVDADCACLLEPQPASTTAASAAAVRIDRARTGGNDSGLDDRRRAERRDHLGPEAAQRLHRLLVRRAAGMAEAQ